MDGAVIHYGPTFGWIETSQGLHERLHASTGDTRDGMDAADLRSLAADALAAAEWLEANQ